MGADLCIVHVSVRACVSVAQGGFLEPWALLRKPKHFRTSQSFSMQLLYELSSVKSLIYFKTEKGKSVETEITFSRSLSCVVGPQGEKPCALDLA